MEEDGRGIVGIVGVGVRVRVRVWVGYVEIQNDVGGGRVIESVGKGCEIVGGGGRREGGQAGVAAETVTFAVGKHFPEFFLNSRKSFIFCMMQNHNLDCCCVLS